MRSDSTALIDANSSLSKEPRYIIEVAFDDAATDLVYFTSHADAPLPASVTSYDGILKKWSATSQKLQPEKANASIGSISFSLVDEDQDVRQLLAAKYALGYSLKGKRIRAYMAYKDMLWADAALVQTQIIDEVSTKDGEYSFSCSDVQRLLRKKIFVLKSTTMQANLTSTATTITVLTTTEFEMVAHGTSYSDAPSATVGYIKIEDEIIRYTGKTSTTFTGCTRGVLNTKAEVHDIGATSNADRRTEVEELVYLEMPAPKLILALLTGSLYGQGASLPSHWNAGTPTAYVREASFTGIGDDFWNTSDDTEGLLVRFVGEKDQDVKKFIEGQLLLLIGCYMPVHGDGELGLRRMVNVLSDAPYVSELTVDNTVSYGALKHNFPEVKNEITIGWNWENNKEDFTRHNVLIDSDSVTVYEGTYSLGLDFRGLHGSLHTGKTIESLFERLRDRFTNEPLRITVTGFFNLNNIEVGDIVKLTNEHIQDYIDDDTCNRSYEVQRVSVDWFTGKTSFLLFGSTLKQSPKILSDVAQVLSSAWYTEIGTNIDTLSGYSGGALTSNVSITGNTNLKSSSAIYYHDGDLTIDAGVTLTISENIQLRVKGFLTINGDINGIGGGITTESSSGYVGTAKAQGSLWIGAKAWSFNAVTTIGLNNSAPELSLTYDSDNDELLGIPSDLRGTTGSSGGDTGFSFFPELGFLDDVKATGGAWGNSGAGLCVISQGLGFGVVGKIDLSGDSGVVGGTFAANPYTIQAGGGAGGSGGTFYSILDGNTAVTTIGVGDLVVLRGSTPFTYTPLNTQDPLWDRDGSSFFVGLSAEDSWQSHHRVQYIPSVEVAEEDENVGIIPAPTSISAASGTEHLLIQPDGTILARVLLSFTSAVDSRIAGYEVQYKLSSDSVWISSTAVLGADSTEAYVLGTVSGGVYDFRIRAASGLRTSSEWLTLSSYTVIGKEEIPPDVTGFIATQSGTQVIFKWDNTSIADSGGFEIRYAAVGNADYNSAQPLTKAVKGTELTSAAIPPASYRFYIKERDTGGRFSENAAYYDLTVRSNADIIYINEEHPTWSGEKENFSIQNDALIPTDDVYAQYTTSEHDLGFDDIVRVWANISASLSNVTLKTDNGFISDGVVTAINDAGSVADAVTVSNDSGSLNYSVGGDSANVSLLIASRKEGEVYSGYDSLSPERGLVSDAVVSTNDRGLITDAITSYNDRDGLIVFIPWTIGDLDMRYIIFRIKGLPNDSGSLPAILEFTTTIDLLERSEKASSLEVDAGGSRFNYVKQFHTLPFIIPNISSSTGLFAVKTAEDVSGFNVKIYNTSGTSVGITSPDEFQYEVTGV